MEERDPRHEAADLGAPGGSEDASLRGIVLDSGALDDLLVDQVRADLVSAARAEEVRLVVPLTVVVEFLLGHPRDPVRADRVLGVLEQVEATPRIARRAASLLARAAQRAGRTPSVTDGMVAAFGEIYGAVATNDPTDLGALASVSEGFDVYVVREVIRTLKAGS